MATLSDYRDREHWSYSALNQFLNICSLQFAFDRLYRLPRAFTPVALSFGSTFHRTLEWMGRVRMEGGTPEQDEARDLFQDLWARQVKEDESIRLEAGRDADDYGAQGADLVQAFLKATDLEEQVIAVSEPFAVPLIDQQGNVLEKPLVGELDCRVCKDDQTVIVDWETSAHRWPKKQADKSLQPTVYVYGHRQLHGADVPFRFDVVVKNKTPVCEQHMTTRTTDQFHRMVEQVKMAERMIEAEHFLPNEGSFYCASCPFQEPCRAWHRQTVRVSVRMAA